MCRVCFLLDGPQGTISFFVEMPARVVNGDAVPVWPLMPVAMAELPEHQWLQDEITFKVASTCWTRDEEGIYLAAMLYHDFGQN